MISSETMMILESVRLEFVRAPNRKIVTVIVNATGVEFYTESSPHFSLFTSDLRLIAAICRQIREPETWNKEGD